MSIYLINENGENDVWSTYDRLEDIADNFGYKIRHSRHTENMAVLIVSDLCALLINYDTDGVTTIRLKLRERSIDCTRTTSVADDISTDIQTSILITKDIRNKLMR